MKGAAEEGFDAASSAAQGMTGGAHWRCAGGELDLVMRHGIAEARKRSNTAFGSAAESVDARKRSRIVHATRLFLAAHSDYAQHEVRFYVLVLDAANNIQWLRAAFDAQDS